MQVRDFTGRVAGHDVVGHTSGEHLTQRLDQGVCSFGVTRFLIAKPSHMARLHSSGGLLAVPMTQVIEDVAANAFRPIVELLKFSGLVVGLA